MYVIIMWIIQRMHWIVPLTALGCFINAKISKTLCKTRRGSIFKCNILFLFPLLDCDSVILLSLNESLE
ncbi:unnamed protein product [Lupinus luteus]|uniref:Secreted protein n=1 Tax=Lupinus luteus TaxID=3873 RepID=A0AAV1XFE9_LUPLU